MESRNPLMITKDDYKYDDNISLLESALNQGFRRYQRNHLPKDKFYHNSIVYILKDYSVLMLYKKTANKTICHFFGNQETLSQIMKVASKKGWYPTSANLN